MHLAQANVSRLLAPVSDPLLAGFAAASEPIEAAGAAAPGFLWRAHLEVPRGGRTHPFAWDLGDSAGLIVNLSVWTSLETLDHFVHSGTHLEALRQRRSWFARHPGRRTSCGGSRTGIARGCRRPRSGCGTYGRTAPRRTPSPLRGRSPRPTLRTPCPATRSVAARLRGRPRREQSRGQSTAGLLDDLVHAPEVAGVQQKRGAITGLDHVAPVGAARHPDDVLLPGRRGRGPAGAAPRRRRPGRAGKHVAHRATAADGTRVPPVAGSGSGSSLLTPSRSSCASPGSSTSRCSAAAWTASRTSPEVRFSVCS